MLTEYIRAAMRRAVYEPIEEDGTYFGYVPELNGAWANNDKLEQCRDELEETIEDWVFFSIREGLPIPVLDGIDLSLKPITEEVEAG